MNHSGTPEAMVVLSNNGQPLLKISFPDLDAESLPLENSFTYLSHLPPV